MLGAAAYRRRRGGLQRAIPIDVEAASGAAADRGISGSAPRRSRRRGPDRKAPASALAALSADDNAEGDCPSENSGAQESGGEGRVDG